MKEEALEAGRPNRKPLHSSEEENVTGLMMEILRKPNRGNLEKAQGRCMGQGHVKDGFSKNPQVDAHTDGTRTQKPCCPEWCSVVRDLDLNCSSGTGCVTLGNPILLSELSFLICKARMIMSTPLYEDEIRFLSAEFAPWRPARLSASMQHFTFEDTLEHSSRWYGYIRDQKTHTHKSQCLKTELILTFKNQELSPKKSEFLVFLTSWKAWPL